MTRAFTLIELLVVVTIIVVLLALLTPALDKAILSDTNLLAWQNGAAQASHPDKEDVLVNMSAQHGEWEYGNAAMDASFNAALPVTYSFWRVVGRQGGHGPMDLNFAGDDASVQRLIDVRNDDRNADERVLHAPNQRQSGSWQIWIHVAK